ncbi:TNF receptor-associated factor 6-like [Dermacentor andersoni]|uniref:TNF receptor-associated factor 6-like n=1 Tax=Dermacentor andersoni TaxID=34620 RepID=UPI00241801CF|nr:TNF receptor-associated factor 6-like [Dermacentor andersoni]
MASQGKRYTLCGFNEELDWRPLHFLGPVPAHRICDACGVLSRKTVFLPCQHVLCKSCFEQCVLHKGHACLLDGDQFIPEEAEWREFPLENLLRRKIKCWNEERGCDVVLPASELNKHFCNDCEHHATSCPKCSKLVLRSNIAAHLQSKCRDYAVSLTSGAAEKSHSDGKAMMMAVNASLYVRVVEMKDTLDEVISDHIVQYDRLNEISHCINTVKEALLHRSSGSSTLDSLTSQCTVTLSSVREVKERLIDHSEETRVLSGTLMNSIKELKEVLQDTARTFSLNCVGSVAGIGGAKDTEKKGGHSTLNKELALHTININRYEFMAKGYEAMKKSARSEGYHICAEEKIYMSGYHVSPGVHFRKAGDHVFLHPRFQLHKGVIDEFLQWPFTKNIRVTVKHSSQSKQCQKVWNTSGTLQYFGRPGETANDGSCSTFVSFSLNDLEGEGYVKEDKLHIVWELLPKPVAE